MSRKSTDNVGKENGCSETTYCPARRNMWGEHTPGESTSVACPRPAHDYDHRPAILQKCDHSFDAERALPSRRVQDQSAPVRTTPPHCEYRHHLRPPLHLPCGETSQPSRPIDRYAHRSASDDLVARTQPNCSGTSAHRVHVTEISQKSLAAASSQPDPPRRWTASTTTTDGAGAHTAEDELHRHADDAAAAATSD